MSYMSSNDDLSEQFSDEEDSSEQGTDYASDATSGSLASLQQYDEEIPGPDKGPLFDLAQALASASQDPGEFSFGGSADFLPTNPSLHVEGFGNVALPLIDHAEAEALKKVCEQAPYGHGRKTLVDTSVRNSWQLDPSRITLSTTFSSGIQSARDLVARRLGVPGVPLNIELYKFLLYGPGGHFAKHRDTEKADRMFATLIVQFPSAHSGGSLMVYGDGPDPVSHDFGQASGSAKERCHYAVHYADAEHALCAVTEGYRLAMVYSICWPAGAQQPTPLTAQLATVISKAMLELAEQDTRFHLFLSHDYTPKSISELGLGALKGIDRKHINNLRSVNSELDPANQFSFYLGKAERSTAYYGLDPPWADRPCHDWEVSAGPREDICELLSATGESVAKTNGTSLSELDSEFCLNPGRKRISELWRGHREVDYEGYLGNEGPTKDTTYHKYVVMVWPRRSLFLHLLDIAGEVVGWRELMKTEPTADEVDSFLTRTLLKRGPSRIGQDAQAIIPRRSIFLAIQAHEGEARYPSLIDKYISLHPDASNLVSDGTGWIDLLTLVQNAAVWSRIEEDVIRCFARNTETIFDLLAHCIQAGVPKASYRRVEQQLLKPGSASEGRHEPSVQQAIFRAVLRSDNAALCSHVIEQYRRVLPENLDVPIDTILSFFGHTLALFTEEKRALLSPMLRKRMLWSAEFRAEVGSEGMTWAFKDASFINYSDYNGPVDILAFLKRDQKELEIRPFPNIKQARRFCEDNRRSGQQCSFTLDPRGVGKKAYVVMMKNKSYYGVRTKRALGLLREAEQLQRIFESDSSTGQPLGEVQGNVRGRGEETIAGPTKPIKKPRLSKDQGIA